MDRRPPKDVRRILSREVGYGCPIPHCGSPYLEWHHFDPTWKERNHHEPSGMIALCSEHHPIADGGAFTKEQLHSFKLNGVNNQNVIKGRFNWRRNQLLLNVGAFYYETLNILRYKNNPVIWFERNEDGYLLLNLRMFQTTDEERLYLENNEWIGTGSPSFFECPPSGRLIHAKYNNGDEIRIEFFELETEEKAQKRYKTIDIRGWNDYLIKHRRLTPEHLVRFPLTAIEIIYKIPAIGWNLSKHTSKFGGVIMNGAFFAYADYPISIS